MKRNFTQILAAFALLVGLTIPMGVWGQTLSFAPNQTTTGSNSSNYVSTETEFTTGNVTFKINNWNPSSLQIRGNQTTQQNLQSGANFYLHNTTAMPGNITGITITYTAGTIVAANTYAMTSNSAITSQSTNNSTAGTAASGSVTWTFDGSSPFFAIGMVKGATSGTTLCGTITITYTSGGQTLDPCDLALTGAPITLTFDLYNNSSAQSISFSTSSTGAVTVDENDYVETDIENNTITVTPMAVTNGNKTITVRQAADATYAAGTATFTVNITDSTPFTGGDVTFVCGEDMSATMSLSKNGVTMEFESSGGTWNRTDNYRLYSGKSMTISTSNGTITSIAFEISQNNFSGDGYDAETKIWTGNAETITLAADGGQVRFTPVVVTVNMSGTPDPVITADNVSIEFDAIAGEITYTIANPVEGATIVPEIASGATISNFSLGDETISPISFTCDANNTTTARTATVTLNYVKNGETLATKDVTITQAAAPVVYTTIPALFDAATETETNVLVTFDNWVVSGVSTNGNNVFVTDNEGHGFVIYSGSDMSSTYSAGKVLAGTAVSCKLKKYNGFAELLNVNASDLTITDGGTVTTADITMASLAGINTGALVHYDNLTCSVNNNKYYLSDGTTTLQVYNALFAFEALEDGETYNITGVYQQYNNTKEILPRSAEDIVEVQVQHDEYTLTVDDPAHVTFTVNYDEEVLTNGETAEILDGTEVTFTVNVASGYVLEDVTVLGENQQVVSFAETSGVYTFNMPAYNVTISAMATEYVAPTGDEYELYTGALTEGDYLIVYDGDAMNTTVESDRLQYEDVTVNNDVIVTDNAAIIWHIAPSGQYWTIYNADADAYAASTGAKNKAQMLADGTDDKALWTVSGSETYEFVNKKNTDNNVNANLRKNGTYGFACYATSTGGALSLYKKVEATPAGPTITVNGYGDTNGGYVLLAWPESTSPTAINGMISDNLGAQVTPETPGTYDLYSYDESQEMEWRNYRTNSFELVPGKGYLYASKAGVTLTYEGEASPVFADVNLPYTENKIVKSIYLAGNSKTNEQTFYVYNSELAKQTFNYLTMNEDGNGFISAQATSYTAPAMTGFFVQAPGANMTLSTTDVNAKANASLLNINVLRDRGSVIDNAIVSFSNGSMMEKFYLMNNTTRMYIPQGNRELAIANSAAEAEMPVSFRASENGTYTIAVEAENVDMNYLHLIDNMTGADVDLLATPNYTFEARTNDYTSRFRLVFSANGIDEQNAETFAFFNGTSWTVSNTGDATLQVVDITGRIVSSETINGNATVSLNQPAGIYMLRLVNGNDVKVQKVVVR